MHDCWRQLWKNSIYRIQWRSWSYSWKNCLRCSCRAREDINSYNLLIQNYAEVNMYLNNCLCWSYYYLLGWEKWRVPNHSLSFWETPVYYNYSFDWRKCQQILSHLQCSRHVWRIWDKWKQLTRWWWWFQCRS